MIMDKHQIVKKLKYVKLLHNFITKEESKILTNWSLSNYQNPYFFDPKMNNDVMQTRFTTRHAHGREEKFKDYKVVYPKEAYDIQKRILKYLNLKPKNFIPFPSFTDGVITTVAIPPGSCIKHKDPIYHKDTYTLHCNFCTQNPESGGVTILEGKEYYFNNTDMIMYLSSHLEHEVSECVGNIPRVLWVFGFCLNLHEVNNIFNIKNIHYT